VGPHQRGVQVHDQWVARVCAVIASMVSGQRPRPSAYRRAGGVDPRQRSGRVRSQLRWSARPSDQRPPHRLPSPYATGPTPRPARARSPPPSRSAGAIRLLRDRLMDDEASAFAVRREPSSASSAWVWASWIRPVVGAGERGT